jgi:aryl-alcohol dehydrogenase-like predicted oxidoreductase
MLYGHLSGIDKPISRLVLGTVAFEHELTESEAWALLDAFAELGGTAIDTGRHYGDPTERAIGRWLRERDNRHDVVLVGKGGHPKAGRNRITRKDIAGDLERSLELLQTDSIDLLLLHRDDPSVPAGEVVEWLNEHVRAGSINAFGGSNWTTERLDKADEYAGRHCLIPFAASSSQFSLAVPRELPWAGCVAVSGADRGWYARRQLPLLAWAAQGQGFFSGRFTPGAGSYEAMAKIWCTSENSERLRRTKDLGRRMGAPPIAVALSWALRQSFPTFAIIGPRTVHELRDSAAALAIELTPEQLRWLDLQTNESPNQ